MRPHCACLFVLTIALGMSGPVAGQTFLQKLQDALAGRKTPPPPAELPRETDARMMEILVELAWLGDPMTFPFYLEARVEGPILHVRGNVPSPAIRDHALKLAQMNTPLPVADGFKVNPRLVVRPTRMTQDQLQNVVRSALRESVPSLAKNLQTRCTADGQVAVLGNVENFERKLAISQALRRLHGCTVVINKTKVAYDPDGYLARHAAHPPAQTVSNTAPVPAPVGQLPDPNVVVKSGSPGLPPSPPVNIQKPPSITVSPGEAPGSVTPNAPRLSPVQVQQRIKDVCPKAVEVKVSPTANGDLKVEINVREEADCEAILGQIYGISELAALQLRPEFKVSAPGKN